MQKCIVCDVETKNPKFCSHSCSASFNNKFRDKPIEIKNKQCNCIGCGQTIEINIHASISNAKCKICKGKCKHCKQPAKYELKGGSLCCCPSSNQCPEIRRRNSNGVSDAHKNGKIPGWNKIRETHNIDTTWNRGLNSFEDTRIRCNYDHSKLFTDGNSERGPRKKVLISERGYKCERCGITEWLSEKIVLELEHIDGNRSNNLKENLQLLCPNCHSLTSTWRGRNSNTGRRKYTDEVMIDAFIVEGNIHKALIKLQMAPKGANYQSMYKLLERHGLLNNE